MNPEDEDTRRSEQPEPAPTAEDTAPEVEAEDAESRAEAEDRPSGVPSDQPEASSDQDGASVDDQAADTVAAAAEAAEDTEAVEDERDPWEIAQEEAAQWKDKCLRTAADFDNYRKRSRREQLEADRRAREDLLREILPVFDNLERAANHAETATEVKSLVDGIGMVMRQFRDTVGKLGVERIEAVGKPFDPALHEAIQHLETEEYDPGCVAAEVQAGYRMGDRLLRPAMVVVAKAKTGEPA